MRVLFSAVPAYGHILPLAPLMEELINQSHDVALVATDAVRSVAVDELHRSVEFLPAGVPAQVFIEEAAKRTGADPFHPTPSTLAETFGGVRLDLDGEDALSAARAWKPDIVLADSFDAVGPFIAASLGVPWHQVGLGPGLDASIVTLIAGSTSSRYDRAGVDPVAPRTYIDPCPQAFQDPEWTAPAETLKLRAQAHHRTSPGPGQLPDFADPEKPTVLLTLGTVFASPESLTDFANALASLNVNVLATTGPTVSQPSVTANSDNVQWVRFVPLDRLLDVTDLVVSAGGSGTILGAMSRGVPMVLCPQGADQPINAVRAKSAGVALVVELVTEITDAVAVAIGDPDLKARAVEVAAEIADAPTASSVVSDLIDRSTKSPNKEM